MAKAASRYSQAQEASKRSSKKNNITSKFKDTNQLDYRQVTKGNNESSELSVRLSSHQFTESSISSSSVHDEIKLYDDFDEEKI